MTITEELRAAIEASRVCGDDNTADLLQRALDEIESLSLMIYEWNSIAAERDLAQ